MTPHMLIEGQTFVGDRSHQVDAAPRTVIFISQFGIRRAGSRAEAAVDAIQKIVVVDVRARVYRGAQLTLLRGIIG